MSNNFPNIRPPAPFIIRIPNEILHHILSFLPDLSRGEPFVQYHSNGKDHEVSQMVVLRSVCRHFRAITAELYFWYDVDFRFSDLTLHSYDTFLFIRHDKEKRFLKVLLTDANLVNSLGQCKKDWNFEILEGLMAVMESVP
jgi:hypothetical protein